PKLFISSVDEKDMGNGYLAITVTVGNERMIPTHSSHDIKNKITRPDYISIEGVEVVSGMRVLNIDRNETKEQVFEPKKLAVPNVPGLGSATVRWIVKRKSNQNYSITVDSAKGGVIRQ
ncbi:MAG: peptidase M14, partial [Bacteroidota bacterium]